MDTEQHQQQSEAQRQQNEQGRCDAEEQRHTNEEVRQSGEDIRHAAEAMRESAEIIRETAATKRRTHDTRLSRVEARLDRFEERLAQLEAAIRQRLEEIRRAMPQRSAQSMAEVRFTDAQRMHDEAHLAHQRFLETQQQLAQFQVVVFDAACATVMERLRQQYRRRKRYADLMIAAITAAGQHILATRNQGWCTFIERRIHRPQHRG